MSLVGHIEETAERILYGNLLRDLLHTFTFKTLTSGVTVEQVARASGGEASALVDILQIACRLPGLLEFNGTHCRLAKMSEVEAFRLVKYFGAYGDALGNPLSALGGSHAPCMDHLADAYLEISAPRPGVCSLVLERLSLSPIAELGCGSAPVLRGLAVRRPQVRGWAVDPSPAMVRLARQCVERDGVEARIQVLQGSIEAVCDRKVEFVGPPAAICLRGVLNSYFGAPGECANLLRRIARAFPEAYVVISDYFSDAGASGDCLRSTRVHDAVQILSGQGRPPGSEVAWHAIYASAGYERLHHALDDSVDGIRQFVDVLAVGDLS